MKTTEIKKDDTYTWYEHRATKTLKVEEFYGEDVIVEKGMVIVCTRKPEKLTRYEYGFDGGRAYGLYPVELVKVFKVTERTVKEIITEKKTKKIAAGEKRIYNTRTTNEIVDRVEEEVVA